MKIRILIASSVLFLCVDSFAQRPAPAPASTPAPAPPPAPQTPPSTVYRPVMRQPLPTMNIPSLESLDPASISDSDRVAIQRQMLQKYATPMYRKPTRQELEAVALSPGLLEKFRAFLQRPNTGLFKLVPDAGCADNERIVTASETCLKFTFPGAGNSFSFRTKNYRIRHLADLTYSGQRLHVTGVLMHGILVNLGDLPLDNISLQTKGLSYLVDFQPSTGVIDANKLDEMLAHGVERDGYLYSRSLTANENTTYAVRAIAYRGRVLRAVKGVSYNELDFDKRRDIIVAFRIVQKEPDGSISILWNQLSDNEAPKMKQPAKKTSKEDGDKLASSGSKQN